MYQLGLTTVTFRNKSREEICKIAKSNSITHIEWGGDIHLPSGNIAAIENVIKLQKEHSINSISYGSYYKLGMKDFEKWRELTKTAASIGANVIRIWQGNLPSNQVSKELLSEMIEETKQLAEIANEQNIIIAFEFHKGTNNDSGASAVEFLKKVNLKNVLTYWQPFSTPEDINNLKAVLPYLIGVHVFHWNKRGKRYPFCKGAKIWQKFITIIAQSGISVNYIIEFVKSDSTKQFEKDVIAIRSILGGIYGK